MHIFICALGDIFMNKLAMGRKPSAASSRDIVYYTNTLALGETTSMDTK